MNSHKNAPLTPKGREAMVRSVVEKGLSKAAAARQFNTTPKTVAKWVKRLRAEGVDGLRDRSSRPHSLPGQTPLATCSEIERLRRQRLTGKQIAIELEVSPATVSRVLCRLGLNRMRDLEPAEPVSLFRPDADQISIGRDRYRWPHLENRFVLELGTGTIRPRTAARFVAAGPEHYGLQIFDCEFFAAF